MDGPLCSAKVGNQELTVCEIYHVFGLSYQFITELVINIKKQQKLQFNKTFWIINSYSRRSRPF